MYQLQTLKCPFSLYGFQTLCLLCLSRPRFIIDLEIISLFIMSIQSLFYQLVATCSLPEELNVTSSNHQLNEYSIEYLNGPSEIKPNKFNVMTVYVCSDNQPLSTVNNKCFSINIRHVAVNCIFTVFDHQMATKSFQWLCTRERLEDNSVTPPHGRGPLTCCFVYSVNTTDSL